MNESLNDMILLVEHLLIKMESGESIGINTHQQEISCLGSILRNIPNSMIVEHCLLTEVISREDPFKKGDIKPDDIRHMLSVIDASDLNASKDVIEKHFGAKLIERKRLMSMRCPDEIVIKSMIDAGHGEPTKERIESIQEKIFYGYNHSVSTSSQVRQLCLDMEDENLLALLDM
jgi:hypothetical protein